MTCTCGEPMKSEQEYVIHCSILQPTRIGKTPDECIEEFKKFRDRHKLIR